ncbi:MAG: SUMF1/EgtB/PvdO family nonheme iron enzyme [Fibrobacterales bacterium]
MKSSATLLTLVLAVGISHISLFAQDASQAPAATTVPVKESSPNTATKPVNTVDLKKLTITTEPAGVTVLNNGVEVCTTPCGLSDITPGVTHYTLQKKGYYSIVYRMDSENQSQPPVLLAELPAPEGTNSKENTFEITETDSVESLTIKLDTLNTALLNLHSKLEGRFKEYSSKYPKPIAKPDSLPPAETKLFDVYSDLFEKEKLSTFRISTAPYRTTIDGFESLRLKLKERIFALEQEDRTVYLIPDGLKSKLLDKATGKYGLKFKFSALNKRIDALFKGIAVLPKGLDTVAINGLSSAKSKTLKKAPKKGVVLKAIYQNKSAKITTATATVSRYYILKEIAIVVDGAEYAVDGDFSLPPYIMENTIVKKYFDDLTNSEAKKDMIASNKQKYLQDKQRDRTAKRLKRDLQRLRGDVVEIQRGRFDYKGRNVLMSPFAINTYEITQRHYQRIRGTAEDDDERYEYSFKHDSVPAHNVDWDMAKEFCEDIGGDLPTEAQWEYAARSGTSSYFFWGAETVDGSPYAIYDANSLNLGKKHPEYGPHKIGSKKANAWGLYDMYGNVAEWTDDVDPYFFINIVTAKDPTGATFGFSQIYKGGSWKDDPSYLKNDWNEYEDPRFWSDALGLRCVFPAQQVLTQAEITKRLNKHEKPRKYADELFEEQESIDKSKQKKLPVAKEKSALEKKKELLKKMKENKIKKDSLAKPLKKGTSDSTKTKSKPIAKTNIEKVQELQDATAKQIIKNDSAEAKPEPTVTATPVEVQKAQQETDKTKSTTPVSPKKNPTPEPKKSAPKEATY